MKTKKKEKIDIPAVPVWWWGNEQQWRELQEILLSQMYVQKGKAKRLRQLLR